MNPERIKEILEEWRWARGLTLDLLQALPEHSFHVAPLQGCGTWGKQFRHLGRVQENYIKALESGVIEFTPKGCSFRAKISKSEILTYLKLMDSKLLEGTAFLPPTVKWYGESWSSEKHLQALVSHEILHHGELILYARVSGFKLPASWKDWGEG